MSDEYKPVSQEIHPDYNRQPGVVVVPGSNFANEMMKFEQFPSKYGNAPGNPYTYRPFPKMLYKAQTPPGGGAPKCMASPPDSAEFTNPQEFQRAEQQARKFTEQCQLVVNDDVEYSKARENGWCESPVDAVEWAQNRDRAIGEATAHRNYEDRNMSEAAQREIRAQIAEHGGEHQPEIIEKRRGRPKGSKNRPKE